ncbi:MAG: hypothetical protein IPN83_00010 [Holophagales bacterium]|nr:hypothetical protein [Holophagales bacterium]
MSEFPGPPPGSGLPALIARRLLPREGPGCRTSGSRALCRRGRARHTLVSPSGPAPRALASSPPRRRRASGFSERGSGTSPPRASAVSPRSAPVGPAAPRSWRRPGSAVLVETELWPVLLRAAGRRALPVLVANGRLSGTLGPASSRRRRFFRAPLAASPRWRPGPRGRGPLRIDRRPRGSDPRRRGT